jgi:hypothetical protein
VLGAVDWANLQVAGAFVLGAILATVAVLRVVRAVAVLFGPDQYRHVPRRRDDDRPPGE